MKTEYYKSIEVWRKKDDSILECYEIFQRISDSYFAVQSRDCYLKDKFTEQEKEFRIQKKELFLEENIEERGIFRKTIEDCIEDFNRSFD